MYPHKLLNNMKETNSTHLITAGYFGKLPQYTDFIKHNSGGPEILIIDDWIQQGLLSAKKQMKDTWKQIYRNAPSYFFIYPFTNTQNIIAGIIQSSTDKIRREYPFITFLLIPRFLVKSDEYPKLPLLLSEHYLIMQNLSKKNLSKLNEQITSMTTSTLDSEFEENIDDYLSVPQINFWRNTFNNSFHQEIFRNDLLELHNGLPLIKTTITSDESLIGFDLCVLTSLITGVANQKEIPAIFWTPAQNTCTILYLFAPGALQYSDLFSYDSDSVNQITHPADNIDLFNSQITLKELINELEKLKKINA